MRARNATFNTTVPGSPDTIEPAESTKNQTISARSIGEPRVYVAMRKRPPDYGQHEDTPASHESAENSVEGVSGATEGSRIVVDWPRQHVEKLEPQRVQGLGACCCGDETHGDRRHAGDPKKSQAGHRGHVA